MKRRPTGGGFGFFPDGSYLGVQSTWESFLEIEDRLGESGRSDRNLMANYSDSRTQRTLLERLAQSGGRNQAAWSEFVNRYGRKIYGWCLRWRLQDADAQDVTQIVLLKLAQRMKDFTYDPGRSFRAWLKTVTHHAWQDYVNSRQTATLATGGDPAEERLESVAARDDLSRELERLFDLDLLETAMQRVRLRGPPHLDGLLDDGGGRHPGAGGRPAAGDEGRPGLRGPQHDPAAIAGGVPAIGIGAGSVVTRGPDPRQSRMESSPGTGTRRCPTAPRARPWSDSSPARSTTASRMTSRARRGVLRLPARPRRPGRQTIAQAGGS